MKDKVVVVTGGASGLGKATAERFAAEGAVTVIVDIDAKAMQGTVAEINGRGLQAAGWRVDVSSRDEVQSFVKDAVAKLGHIDVLVNNAGVTRHAPFLEIDDRGWDVVLGVDLKGVFYCAQAVAPHMVRRSYGKIVNIASIAGAGATSHAAGGSPAGNASYASAKAGVIQLTKTLARELGRSGINVNCVAPGFFVTPMTGRTRTPQEVEEHIAARSQAAVLGRPGQPAELANVVLFLASDEASFVSGQTLCVDGGRSDKM